VVIDSEKDAPKGIAMTEANAVIASVTVIPVKVINVLPLTYQIPDPLPWCQIAGPLSLSVSDFNLQRLTENQSTLFRLRLQQNRHSALTLMAFRSRTSEHSQRPS